MKFLIIQICDNNCHNGPPISEIAKISKKSTQEYCDFHGYDYLFLENNPDITRHISWGRSFLVKEYLKNYDWIWCIDCDLMIMNHSIKLEHIVDNKYDIMVCSNKNNEINHLNTGSILWKNGEFSHNLLEEMYKDGEFANKGFWEQSTLIKIIQDNPKLLNNVKIVSKRLINSFYHYWFGDENYQHGDFVVHLAGTDNDYRHETIKNLEPYIIKPIKNIQEKVRIWDR